MKKSSIGILIIGAGLSGLTIGYYLSKQNIPFKIIEARGRMGGRVQTTSNNNSAPIELGATWVAKEHLELKKILSDLNLDLIEQALGKFAIY
jgi:monoamine oxidase